MIQDITLINRCKIFTASLDKLAKGITIGITLLFACLIILPFFIRTNIGWITSIVLGVAYLISFLLRPISYQIINDDIVIKQTIRNLTIKKALIAAVEVIDDSVLATSLRSFGVGGLFGYFGKFYNRKIGAMTWYATRRNNALLITTTDNQKVVITPDQPIEFIRQLNFG